MRKQRRHASAPSAIQSTRYLRLWRVEHEDHAKSHGRRVGANMAGADESSEHLPFSYSDLFDLGYEAVGDLDAAREPVSVGVLGERIGR